ncbi:MAG: diaminopimelate decarboxylase [Blastochloris sp.]|nr:diaminopimelate decarboxylase [Blastochloris sp.]
MRKLAAQVGTPVYIYSLRRALNNYHTIKAAFPKAHLHYSVKANGNLAVLRALIQHGAGIDAVSGGEIHRALAAGAVPGDIVFAGVGKTTQEIADAHAQGIGWFNIENIDECRLLNVIAGEVGRSARVALRLNPDVSANTIAKINTGHGGAKFGLSADAVRYLLDNQTDYPHLRFEGLHLHIGSQLGDTNATAQAIRAALNVIAPFSNVRTLNIGGGLPVAYAPGSNLPTPADFAAALLPLIEGYDLILEPGRSIIADAGILVARVLYVKPQGEQLFVILDAGMTDLIRPALYEAHHEILPVRADEAAPVLHAHIVGPVCETTDVLASGVPMPGAEPGALVALMTAGAYGMVMASNYNARPRPPEVVVSEEGDTWHVARRRETYADLLAFEVSE